MFAAFRPARIFKTDVRANPDIFGDDTSPLTLTPNADPESLLLFAADGRR